MALVSKIRSLLYRTGSRLNAGLSRGQLNWSPSVRAQVPVRCDGKGSVTLDRKVTLGYRLAPRIGSGQILLQAREPNSVITIGERTATSNNVSIISTVRIEIGASCLIGDLVLIIDSDFHEIDPLHRHTGSGESKEVIIGDNVWLGSRVMVLKGVTIGDNTVVAAGSIVTQSLPANVVAAGIPAKVIRKID